MMAMLRIGSRPVRLSNHPLIAFEHLSLYIQKHLGQSVAVAVFIRCLFIRSTRLTRQSAVLHASVMPFLISQ